MSTGRLISHKNHTGKLTSINKHYSTIDTAQPSVAARQRNIATSNFVRKNCITLELHHVTWPAASPTCRPIGLLGIMIHIYQQNIHAQNWRHVEKKIINITGQLEIHVPNNIVT